MNTQRPIWEPSKERIERANLSRFIRFVQPDHQDVTDHASLYDFSIREPEKFWRALWEFCGIRASGDFEPMLVDGDKMPGARWFPNVKLNFAQNLLRHKDDRIALIACNERGHKRELSYAQLHEEVGKLGAALREAGVVEGDRVAGLMPNIPEAVIAMLAATSLGAIWSSCSPDLGVNGIVDRFGQIAPKVLFTADAYSYAGKTFDCLAKIRDVLAKIPSIEKLVVVPYSGAALKLDGIANAVSLPDFAGSEPRELDFVQTAFDHPLYLMYSSDTGSAPKCIVHGAGGTLLQHLKELVLHTDLKREDKIFYYTSCGWMMWNWLVSGLAVGASLVLYDGSPSHPDAKALWDLIDEVGISVFGTSAKWIAASEKAGLKPRESHKLLTLKTILSAGSPLADEGFDYVYRDVKERLLLASISGSTDIVSCFALGSPLLPVYRGELQCRGLGLRVEILGDDGKPLRGELGELACTAPFPCMPVGFWNDADGAKYKIAYFSKVENAWCRGDRALLNGHDGIVVPGRPAHDGETPANPQTPDDLRDLTELQH